MRIATAFLFSLSFLLAAPPPQRSRAAHEHGHAKLNIAFETTTGKPAGTIELETPADSVIGFEYEAKSAADKAKRDAALTKLKAKFGEMVVLPAGCAVTPVKVEVHAEEHDHDAKPAAKAAAKSAAKNAAKPAAHKEEHSEVHAEFSVKCAGPIRGKEIRFGFAKHFPKIEELDVQLLADSQQSSLEVKNDRGVLKIQ